MKTIKNEKEFREIATNALNEFIKGIKQEEVEKEKKLADPARVEDMINRSDVYVDYLMTCIIPYVPPTEKELFTLQILEDMYEHQAFNTPNVFKRTLIDLSVYHMSKINVIGTKLMKKTEDINKATLAAMGQMESPTTEDVDEFIGFLESEIFNKIKELSDVEKNQLIELSSYSTHKWFDKSCREFTDLFVDNVEEFIY